MFKSLWFSQMHSWHGPSYSPPLAACNSGPSKFCCLSLLLFDNLYSISLLPFILYCFDCFSLVILIVSFESHFCIFLVSCMCSTVVSVIVDWVSHYSTPGHLLSPIQQFKPMHLNCILRSNFGDVKFLWLFSSSF